MEYVLSIITINYNNKAGLIKTMQSVIGQSWKQFEYVIIDGGSNDGSKETIEQYADHVSYRVSEKDNGIYNAMNKGILAAKGEYVLFINSGDVLHDKDVLQNCQASLVQQTDFVYGNTIFDKKW